MLIVRRSYSKREEGLTFMEHWSCAGCQLDNWNKDQLAYAFDRAGNEGLGTWLRNSPNLTANNWQSWDSTLSPISWTLKPATMTVAARVWKFTFPFLFSLLLSYSWVHIFSHFPSCILTYLPQPTNALILTDLQAFLEWNSEHFLCDLLSGPISANKYFLKSSQNRGYHIPSPNESKWNF